MIKANSETSALFSSIVFFTLVTYSARSLSVIFSPFIRMRSLNTSRYGDVKSPVLKPLFFSISAVIAAVEPLPFVPAMCMNFSFFCGLPR